MDLPDEEYEVHFGPIDSGERLLQFYEFKGRQTGKTTKMIHTIAQIYHNTKSNILLVVYSHDYGREILRKLNYDYQIPINVTEHRSKDRRIQIVVLPTEQSMNDHKNIVVYGKSLFNNPSQGIEVIYDNAVVDVWTQQMMSNATEFIKFQLGVHNTEPRK